MTLLVDIGDAPACSCDHALDELFKAMAAEPEPEGIWRPVDDPLTGAYIEAVTGNFQRILQAIQDVFSRLLTGETHDLLKAAEVPWERWSPADFEAVRARLAELPAAAYTLDDWLLLIDWVLQRYLGPEVIKTEAEHIAVRSAVLGRLQASMPAGRPNMPVRPADVWRYVHTEFGAIPPKVFTPAETATMRFAAANAANHISAVTESARARMKTLIIQHAQAQILGQKQGRYTALQSALFDEFADLNRDFRRIAVTEVGEAVNQGFIAAQPIGAKVKRLEAYRGACDFCRSINGKVYTVVSPAAASKDGQTEVWVGKTNIGRHASPRQRVGNVLVERPAAERWWPAAGLQHPHCRGRWLPVAAHQAASPEFDAWLKARLRERIPELAQLEETAA